MVLSDVVPTSDIESMNSPALLSSRSLSLAIAGIMLCTASHAGIAAEDGVVRIGGTGMALAAMRQVGERLRAGDPTIGVEVLPSLGTPGGLKALAEGAIDVAVIARVSDGRGKGARRRRGDLSDDRPRVRVLASSAKRDHQGRPAGHLCSHGTGVAGRQAAEDPAPLACRLRKRLSDRRDTGHGRRRSRAAYKRSGVPVATTDQENAELALRTAGSFAIMTLLQIHAERLNLRTVALDGVTASAETAGRQDLSVVRTRVHRASSRADAGGGEVRGAPDARRPGRRCMQSLGATPSR